MSDRMAEVKEIAHSDAYVKRSLHGGALRISAQTLTAIDDVDDETKISFALAAYRLHIRAEIVLHGMPDSLGDFEGAE